MKLPYKTNNKMWKTRYFYSEVHLGSRKGTKMASLKTIRMAEFYRECQKNNCTDMLDKKQKAAAKDIADNLLLGYDNIVSFYEEAKSCYNQVQMEEKENRQKAAEEKERKAAEARYKKETPGQLLLSLSNKETDAKDDDQTTVINVFIRPDNSIYSSFENKKEKYETAPTIRATKSNLTSLSYQPSQAVFTGATVGGVTTGGVHYTKDGYSLDQSYTGKGEVTVRLLSNEFVVKCVTVSAFVKNAFKRDKQFNSLVKNNKILCYQNTEKSDIYADWVATAAESGNYQNVMNAAAIYANEKLIEYKKCVEIQKLVNRIISKDFPPTDEELYLTAEAYAQADDFAGWKRAIETYSSIIDYKDSRQRVNELTEKCNNLVDERNKKIKKAVVKTVKSTRTVFKTAAFLTNLLLTIALAAVTILTWTDKEFSTLTAIFLTLSTIVSIPGIGKLILKNKYKLLQKVLRWVIVILLFFIGFAFSV